ncbi:MAG: DNA repair protein RecO, partial [Verrucomicrobiota bacterium]
GGPAGDEAPGKPLGALGGRPARVHRAAGHRASEPGPASRSDGPAAMTSERSGGVILRLRPLGDTSLVVHWLTPDQGRLATVAKGARGPKSALRGRLDWCFEAEFSFRRSRRGDLHTLGEVVVRHPHEALRQRIDAL